MADRLYRSADQPIRDGQTLDQRWNGPDKGLIWCWERGRQRQVEEPELARRADEGELVILNWKGGVQKEPDGVKTKIDNKTRSGSLPYLAQWQGLRGEDLDIELDGDRLIVCTSTGQAVLFSAKRKDV